jgi:hypothetical protein
MKLEKKTFIIFTIVTIFMFLKHLKGVNHDKILISQEELDSPRRGPNSNVVKDEKPLTIQKFEHGCDCKKNSKIIIEHFNNHSSVFAETIGGTTDENRKLLYNLGKDEVKDLVTFIKPYRAVNPKK